MIDSPSGPGHSPQVQVRRIGKSTTMAWLSVDGESNGRVVGLKPPRFGGLGPGH